MIKVKYSSIDRYRVAKTFKTLKGARAFAQKWVGKFPEMGSTYAIAGDGVGKIECEGIPLRDLFGDEKIAAPMKSDPYDAGFDDYDEQAAWEAEMRKEEALEITQIKEQERLSRPWRAPGCTCTDHQLNQVGCDCDVSYERIPF